MDKYAHRNLGEMYLEEKKYAAALPGKALSINPEEAGLKSAIGKAYLNLGDSDKTNAPSTLKDFGTLPGSASLGDSDKANASFDEAVRLSPKPLILNRIAYAAGESSGESFQPEPVEFLKGSESVKSVGDKLRSTRFGIVLPDHSPIKIERRGRLTCSRKEGCSVVLLPSNRPFEEVNTDTAQAEVK